MQRPRGWLLGWRDLRDHSSNLAHCLRSAQKLPKKGQNKMTTTTTDKWLLALHEVARLIARDVPTEDPLNDGECLDDVWEYLKRLGINPDNYRPTAAAKEANQTTPPPDSSSRLFIGVCDRCLQLGTVYFISPNDSADTLCLNCYAAAKAAEAAPQTATPTPEADTKVSPASSVCTGGEWAGYIVVCDKDYDRWAEGIFPDEDSAQTFADAYMAEEQHNGEAYAFAVSMMSANREEWSR
jgi:hypothetical protein